MKTIAKFGIDAKHVGIGTIVELGVIYPEGVDGTHFKCCLSWEDERLRRAIDHLASHGFTPTTGRQAIQPNEFWMRIERSYDRADLDSARHLQLHPEIPFRSYTRTPDGLIELDASNIRPDADIGFARAPWTVVSTRLKELIERAGMARIIFRETRILGSPAKRAKYQGRFWELTSDLILPPMSPRCKFIHGVTGEEVAGDSEAVFVLREGLELPEILFSPAEIRYEHTALESVEPFDLALTREKFVNQYSREIIASRKFYRFCVDLGLEIYWIPVRMETP